MFKTWLPKVENKSGNSIKVLYTDKGGEFISAKLKKFYKKKSITIKYVASYMYKKKRHYRERVEDNCYYEKCTIN